MKARQFVALSLLAASCCFVASCGKSNNSRTMADLVNHIKAAGLTVDDQEGKAADMITASDGIGLTIAGQEVELYKFNLDLPTQKAALKKYQKEGITIVGAPISVLVNGSFMLVVDEQHPKWKEMREAFLSFGQGATAEPSKPSPNGERAPVVIEPKSIENVVDHLRGSGLVVGNITNLPAALAKPPEGVSDQWDIEIDQVDVLVYYCDPATGSQAKTILDNAKKGQFRGPNAALRATSIGHFVIVEPPPLHPSWDRIVNACR